MLDRISQGPEAGTRGGEGQPVPAEGTAARAGGCEAAGSDSSNTFAVTGSRVCEKSESNRGIQKDMQNRVIKDVGERGEIGPSRRLFQEELVHLTSLQGPQRVKDICWCATLLYPEGEVCFDPPQPPWQVFHTLPTSPGWPGRTLWVAVQEERGGSRRDVGPQFPDQGWKPGPLHWEAES